MDERHDSLEQQRKEHDNWIITRWSAAETCELTAQQELLVKGVAQPALVRALPALLSEPLDGERASWLLTQAEGLLRHLEIRKKAALMNWDGNFPRELHAGVLLVVAQQLARLSCYCNDVRYLNTAFKILDWTGDCENSGVDWKKSLYRHAQQECDAAIVQWEQEMLKVAILAPIESSLYARLVVQRLSQLDDVELTGIIVRTPWNWSRLRSEIRRDGSRLFRKVIAKMVRGDQRYAGTDELTPPALKKEWGLEAASLKVLANQHGILHRTVKDHNDPEALDILRAGQPDLVVFTGGGLIRQSLLDIPTLGVMNCHMGILPEYRGMDVVEWPFLDEDDPASWVGLTLHLMDHGVDTGPIIRRCPVPVKTGDTFRSIRDRLEYFMPKEVVAATAAISRGEHQLESQEAADGKQFFVMHPRLTTLAEKRLQAIGNSL